MGLEFQVIPSRCEEIMTEREPEKMVMELSRQKAVDVAKTAGEPGDIVIGADTLVAINGKLLGKPKSREHAFSMLTSMAGKTHQVYTGVTLIRCKTSDTDTVIETFVEQTAVSVAPMSETEINRYLDAGEYKDKAGAYGIQGRFAPYITGINGDFYNVMGLPAAALYRHLKAFLS
jgi:septum formation protein